MDKFSMDHIYRVYDENEGVCVEVRPYPDAPQSSLELCTVDGKSQEWYGKVSLVLFPTQAKLLAKALLKAAEALDQKEEA
jgi:hypothetical protein